MSDTPATEDLEVKPVAPIQADTPEQIVARLRKELAEEREKNSAAHVALTNAIDERDLAARNAEYAEAATEPTLKRIALISNEREHWRTRAARLETQVDAQKAEKIVAMIDERQKLRTDVGHKDKQIADLTRKLDAAQAQVEASRSLARQADQRAQGFEASLEAMQAARGKAQSERDDADGILAEIRRVLQLLGVDVEKTPPMFYPEAIKKLYGTWFGKSVVLQTQVDELLAKVAAARKV